MPGDTVTHRGIHDDEHERLGVDVLVMNGKSGVRPVVPYVPVEQDALRAVIEQIECVDSSQQDAMAIPTYLHWNPLVRWLFHLRHKRVSQLVEVPPGGTILEFGCGIGAFLPSLKAAGLRVYAADLVLDYARALDERLGLGVDFVDGLTQVADGELDAIVAADVLEHVEELPSLLASLRSKLKDDGCLVVSGPTENLAYRLGRIAAGFAGKGDYHHEDARSVEAAIAATGLFTPERAVALPWAVPPHLFRVVRFRCTRSLEQTIATCSD